MKKIIQDLIRKWWATTPLSYKRIQKYCLVVGAFPLIMPDNIKTMLPPSAFVVISAIGFLGAILTQFKTLPDETT